MKRSERLRKQKLEQRLLEMFLKADKRDFTIYATTDKLAKASNETLKRGIKQALKPYCENYIFYIERNAEKNQATIKGYCLPLNEEAIKKAMPKGLFIQFSKSFESKPLFAKLYANKISNDLLSKETIVSRSNHRSPILADKKKHELTRKRYKEERALKLKSKSRYAQLREEAEQFRKQQAKELEEMIKR